MTIINMVGGGGEEPDTSISLFDNTIPIGGGTISGTSIREANASYSTRTPSNIKLVYTTGDFKVVVPSSYISSSTSSTYYLTNTTVSFEISSSSFKSLLSTIAEKQGKNRYTGTITIECLSPNNDYYTTIKADYVYSDGAVTYSSIGTPGKPSKLKLASSGSSSSFTGYVQTFTLN